MRVLSRRARPWAALAIVAAVVTGAAAYAAIPGDDGTIAACYGKGSGIVRIIDAEAGQTCRASENAVNWNQQGVQGPPGAQGPAGETVRGYRVLRATPDEVEVTVVGTGPIGLPEANGTHILAMHLPQGIYMADATVAVRKGFGNGDFLCWVLNGPVFRIFTRTTLGDAPGHIKRNTVSGSGVLSIPAGGGTVTLECWQAEVPEVPGSPSGDNPTVFYATLQATSVSSATLVRYPAGTTTELP